MHNQARATAVSDVYGVGALLYAMLTGSAPVEPLVPPSKVHPDAGAELDALVLRCLSADPALRLPSVSSVAEALLTLVAEAPEADADEFGVDVEIDVDIAMSTRASCLGIGTAAKPAARSAERAGSDTNGRAPRDPFAVRPAQPPAVAAERASPAPPVPVAAARLGRRRTPAPAPPRPSRPLSRSPTNSPRRWRS